MKEMEFSQKGLVGHWKFDEGIGSIVKDISIHGNHGTIDGAIWTNDEQRRMGLLFDGDNDYVNCGNNASLDITGAITIEAWMKQPVFSGLEGILAKKSSDEWAENIGYSLNIHSSNRILWKVGSEETLTEAYFYGGQWYHIVATWTNGTSQKVFVNGVECTYSSQNIASNLSASSDNLKIGTYYIVN